MLRVLITADDFGLAEGVNRGIIQCHKEGIVRSTSLLMNAPFTDQALALADQHPSLEIGIHLGIVEGYSLLGRKSSLSDRLSYFPGQSCLHRHWKHFVPRYLLGRIKGHELEEELRLQIERFLKYRGPIPFANGTQHMHLLPGIQELVLRLAREYKIGALRSPSEVQEDSRWPFSYLLARLGQRLRRLSKTAGGPLIPDRFVGFASSGRFSTQRLEDLLTLLKVQARPNETVEIMCHPGFDCPELREKLPWGYKSFAWDSERQALLASSVRSLIDTHAFELIQFKDLAHA